MESGLAKDLNDAIDLAEWPGQCSYTDWNLQPKCVIAQLVKIRGGDVTKLVENHPITTQDRRDLNLRGYDIITLQKIQNIWDREYLRYASLAQINDAREEMRNFIPFAILPL